MLNKSPAKKISRSLCLKYPPKGITCYNISISFTVIKFFKMKRLLFFLFLFPAPIAFAQTPVAASPVCEECAYGYSLTSISQLTDVKETDAFYVHLQSLVERYGVNVAACNETIFAGSQVLTNVALAQMLSSGLQTISELKKVIISEKNEADQKKIEAKIKLNGFDPFQHKYKLVSALKDVKASDCYYQAVQILLEDYKIDITDKDGLLQSAKPANGKNAGLLLKKVFGLTNLDVTKYATATITKAEFSMLLNMAMDEYNEMLAAATYQ
jgi:hypothetical protein